MNQEQIDKMIETRNIKKGERYRDLIMKEFTRNPGLIIMEDKMTLSDKKHMEVLVKEGYLKHEEGIFILNQLKK